MGRKVFLRIQEKLGPFGVDLLSDRLNVQLRTFFSWRPEPEAWGADAFLQDCRGLAPYAFPPFAKLQRLLVEVYRRKKIVVIITPVWRSQAWFPIMMEMTMNYLGLYSEN